MLVVYPLLGLGQRLGGGDRLLLSCGGAVLVADEVEGERTAGLGHGPQVNGVAHHLGHGHLGLQHGLAVSGGVHAHHAAAALVQVAHHVAHVVVGHGDLQLTDGLHQHGLGLGQSGLERQVGGQLERDLGGVHGVVGAVHQGGLQEHHGIAGQHAVQAALAQALFHGGEVVLGHGAAEHVLLKDHILLLALGLEDNVNIAELAAAAGLLLIAALLADGAADLLTVGHAGGIQLRVHAEAALQLAAQHVDLDVAGAGDHGLVSLGVVGDGEGGVLLVQLVQTGTQLLDLLLGLGGDRPLVAGGGKGQRRKLHIGLGLAQAVAGLDLVHLADGADVAAADLLGLLGLLALHDVQTAQLLGVAGGHVVQGHIAGDLAADDLDHGELAVLVGDGLEHEGSGGAVGIVGHLNRVAVVVLSGLGGHIGSHGHQVHDGLHQHLHAHTGDGAAAQHGAHAALAHADLQALGHVLGGQLHGLEELLHQLLIGAGGGLHQLSAEGLHLVGHVGGNSALALGVVGLVVQQVHDDGDGLVAVGLGGHDGGNGGAVLGLDGLDAGCVVGVGLLHAVDEHHAGLLAQHLPGALHTHGQAVLGVAHDDGALGSADGAHRLAGEIEVAGSVHDVDLLALIHNGGKGQGDGDLALDLLGVVVAGGVAVGGLAQTVDALGHKQHLLDQRGLAGPAVAQQRNIANVISSHSGDVLPSFSSSPPPTRLRTVAQCTDYSLYCRT